MNVLDPVERRRPANETEPVIAQVEENRVANHVAIVIARDELLGLVDFEILEAVDAQIREEFERVRSLDVEVRHVMGLVEQRTCLTP